MQKRKNDVVENTTQGIEYLMNKNKIHVEKGLGTFKTAKEEAKNGKKSITVVANKWIIVPGSEVARASMRPNGW